jgi:F-type H+-transporting ATPase subunit gamma
MSKRRDFEAQLRSLNEIKEIMNAMKNLSLMELHRLTRFLDAQRRVVAGIEAAAADFLLFHPELLPGDQESRNVYLLVGSERGFCGDFNESLLRALENHTGSARDVTVIAIGSKLAAALTGDARVVGSLGGASVVEEVDVVLIRLMKSLTGLSTADRAAAPLRLTVFHHDIAEEGVKISVLRPFQQAATQSIRFTHPPLLYLPAETFVTGLAEQYLFAALHELLYSSLMAENERRMQHMDSAVRRLERTSADLVRRRNILRQEEITEEIEVIMLSVEALE